MEGRGDLVADYIHSDNSRFMESNSRGKAVGTPEIVRDAV